jgi:hypothetical protein
MKTRRDALLSLAAATSLPVLGQHQHSESSTPPPPTAPKYFSAADFRTVTALVDLILPRSETPGASDAGVHFYIDDAVNGKPELRETFRAGLDWLNREAHKEDGRGFADLTVERQTAILTKASDGLFFKVAKDLTIDGYYSSKEGLVQELGWHGNTFLADFPGCTHPEHQG